MFGGAAWEDETSRSFNLSEDFGQLFAAYILTTLMLNLLVGILSHNLGQVD